MGYWYWRPLKSSWDLDHGVTQRFDLPDKGMLSGLMLKLQNKNNVELVNINDPYPPQKITYRLVGNGNYEIIDLRGRQLQALNYWDIGAMPWDSVKVLDDQGNQNYSIIPFGTKLGDPDHGLDLSKFHAGVQFEESNSMTDTVYHEGYSKLTVYGLFRKDPEGGLFNEGFLKKRQIQNRNTATEEQYSVKLPTTNKLRQISLFTEPDLSSGVPDTGPFSVITKIWLGLKSKEEYLLENMGASEFARFMHYFYDRKPETKMWARTGSAADKVIDTMIYEREDSILSPNPGSTAKYAILDNSAMYERHIKPTGFNTGGGGTNVNVYIRNQGILYHGHIPLLMQDPMSKEADWLDAEEQASVHVEWTEGGSSGNIYLVTDELQKTYPS